MKLHHKRYMLGRKVQKIKTRVALVLSAAALTVSGGGMSLAILGNAHAVTPSTVVVHKTDMANNFADVASDPSKWFFYNDETDQIDSALGSMVLGPSTPPEGDGSAQISVSGTERRNLATYQFSGTKLADITELKFSTYNPSTGNGGSATRSGYLNFNVDFDGSDGWQKRLAYVPSVNGAVTQDTWQEWNAADSEAIWCWSGMTGCGGGATSWPTQTGVPFVDPSQQYQKWSDIVAAYPDIAVRTTDSWLGVRVGEPYTSGYTENIDKFVFGTATSVTTFDFEPIAAPTLVSPADGAAVSGGPTQKWTAVSGANHYMYESYSDAGLTSPVYDTTVGGTQRTVGGTQTVTIWWRVAAVDGDGNVGPWSDAWKLVIDNTNPLVAITNPADGSTLWGMNTFDGTASDENSGLRNDEIRLSFRPIVGGVVQSPVKTLHVSVDGSGNWTEDVDTSMLDDGEYRVVARANDNVGNSYSASNTAADTIDVTVDNVARSKNQCKDGGWQYLHTAEGKSFKNQGKCVSYVNHHDGHGRDDERHEEHHSFWEKVRHFRFHVNWSFWHRD